MHCRSVWTTILGRRFNSAHLHNLKIPLIRAVFWYLDEGMDFEILYKPPFSLYILANIVPELEGVPNDN